MKSTGAARTANDASTIERMELEFKDEVPQCERDHCEVAAVKLIVHRCCGHMFVLCAHHTDEVRDMLKVARTLHWAMQCKLCHQQPAPTPSILPYHP